MRVRKKPVEVDAIRYTGSNINDVTDFMGSRFMDNQNPRVLIIRTLEGDMEAKPGDWIIKGVKGEFYPCKPDIFRETYEMVTDK